MGIRQRIATWLLKAADIGGMNVVPWMQGRTYFPMTSHAALVKKYQSWVYACANKNAVNCAQVPLRLYSAKPTSKTKALFPTRRVSPETLKHLQKSPHLIGRISKAVEVEEVLSHPFLDLMTSVNEFMNQFDLLEGMFLDLELTGNAYWQLVSNELNMPQEIWPRMPQYMTIIPDREKFIARYEFSVNRVEKHSLDPGEVVHFKYVNPKNPFYGMGPLEGAIIAADLSVGMNTYEATLMENGARPDMALVLPADAGEPSEIERKRMSTEWNQKFRGNRKAGKITILTGGADLKQISLTPKEMSFIKGRKWSLAEIAAVFGVPLSKLTTEDVNRANAEAGDYSYMKDTILPRLRKVEQKLNEQLLPLYDDRLFVAFDNPVPEDKEFRILEAESRLKTGQTTINEERLRDGMDEVEYGNIPIMPMTMVPLGSQIATEPPPVPPKGKTKAKRTLPPLNHPTNFIDEKYVAELQRYFDRQAEEILGEFDKDADVLKSVSINLDTIHKDRSADFVSAWFDHAKWKAELNELMQPFESRTLTSGGKAALGRISNREFDVLNPEVIKALEQHRIGAVEGITDTTQKALRNNLAAGLAEGEALPDLRKRVSGVFESASRYRAERIARTETIWAWNEGTLQGYKQSGIIEKKQWLSTEDSRTCDFCPTMDGKIVGIDVFYFDKGETLTVPTGSLPFNYEPISHPPLHPGCRCTIVPVIEEF